MSALVWMILGSTLQVLAIDPKTPGDADVPVVTFTPDWRKMFYNETLTIGCTGIPNVQGNQTYIWYRNNNKLDTSQQNFTISSIQLYDRATYQCQTGRSEKSEAVRPHVITDLTILRVSRYVFEGDILTLSCDSRPDVNTTNALVTFKKNSKYLKVKSTESNVFIGKVDSSVAGIYMCSKKAIFNKEEKTSDDEERITVTELFSVPEIKIHPYPISVGAEMTLTCVTTLHPLRAGTELYFAFYKNGWHVQGLSLSNKYRVQLANTKDSGDYTCEVRTATNSVWKMSQIFTIQVQNVVRPVVTFKPNWNKILRTGSLTITCNDNSLIQGSQTYSWYKDNNKLNINRQTITIYGADDNDIGNYQCQTSSGEKSDAVHLDVYFVWLILQVPHSIHEGDNVVMNCLSWSSGIVKNITFYKDDKLINVYFSSSSHFEYNLGIVSKNATGKYKCTKFINTGAASKIYVAEDYISVADLFSTPEIKSNPQLKVEGADVTLTCLTTVSPLRRATELHFAFHRDGQKVQEFSASDTYRIPSAQLVHSGNYSCEVKTLSNLLQKKSKVLSIKVQGMAVVSFTPNAGRIITTESITLTCTVHSKIKENQVYYWYKDNNKINATQKTFVINVATVEDSGYYQCQSSNSHISDHIRLDVSNSDLIVQGPPVIYEGDTLTLKCHHRDGLLFKNVQFFKDGNLLKILESESDLQMGKAYRNTTAIYGCTKQNKISLFLFFADTYVSVTELFTYLQIKVSTSPVIEGEQFTLSCEAALSPSLSLLRGNTELQFAFYKNGQNVQGFRASNKYLINSAQKKDSGNYTCEVKSSTNSVTKMSQAIDIDVQDLFSTPKLSVILNPVTVGEAIVITCDTTLNPSRQTTELQYTFYKGGQFRQKLRLSSKYRVNSVRQDDSGDYLCEVTASPTNIIKRSNTTYVLVQERVSNVRITADQEDQEILAGNNVTFTCTLHYGTSPSFTWLHNSKVVDVNCALYQFRHNGKVLYIESLQQQHSGSYECQVSNKFSSAKSNTLRISVIEPIAGVRITTERKTLSLVPGDSVTFTCAVSQGIATSFLWIHNQEQVDTDPGRYHVKDNGKVLYIKSTQALHGGTYQCKAIKNVSLKRNMVLLSDILTISISDKSHSYLVSTILLSAILVIILISIIVYKYRSKLVKSFMNGHPEQIRVLVHRDEDSLLGMDSLDSFERFSNSHH